MHLKYGIRHGLHDDDDFVGAKFYCPDAFADGNQHFQIGEKTLAFSPQQWYLHCLCTTRTK